jgi:putative DNA primase/helicase
MHNQSKYIALAEKFDAAFDEWHAEPKVHPDGVLITNGADLEPTPIQWLWRDWLALGKLHILAGAPGQGKTTIALAIAAAVTTGGRLPDGTRSDIGNVLIWSGEDDAADTLLPRLLAAGADRARCYFVEGTRINGEMQSFDPSRDMLALERHATAIGGIRLLIVDPVVSAVAGDSHKNTEVRRALQPLVDLASRIGAAVLGISHFSKGGQGSDPASRVVGSIAFTAVARVVLVAAKVNSEDGQQRRILARGKSNIGPDSGGFEYDIEQAEPLPGIAASYIAWGKTVEGTARELFTEADDGIQSDKSAMQEACDFVLAALADGLAQSKWLESEAKSASISIATLRRAKEKLGVKSSKHGGAWYWQLPVQVAQVVHDAQRLDVEHVEHVEQVAQVESLEHEGEQFDLAPEKRTP